MDLSNNEIEELPESIRMLESLKILCVRNAKIRKLPYTIGNRSRLIELDAACCPLNEGIPEQFGALSALAELDFKNSELRELPTIFSKLSSLRSLGLNNCIRLQELPELPTSLTKLRYTSESLLRLPDLSPLTELKNLQFCDSYAWSSFFRRVPDGTRSDGQSIRLSWIGNLHKLQILHLHFTRVSAILPTDLSSFSELKKLDLSYPDIKSLLQLPSCLSRPSISYFKMTIPWMHYSNLRLLHSLELHHSSLMEIQLGGLDQRENLKVLRIADCTKLVSLPGLAGLTRLSSLKLETCPVLVKIPELGQMEMLEHLAFLRCESIASMPEPQELRMKKVGISFCDSLCHIPPMISDCSLRIHSCRWLHDFYGPYWQYQPRKTPELI